MGFVQRKLQRGREKRVSKDLEILQRHNSARAVCSYFQNAVPKGEDIQRFAREKVTEIAEAYESNGDDVRAGILFAALEDHDRFESIFKCLIADGKEGVGKAFDLVRNAQTYLSSEILLRTARTFEDLSLPMASASLYVIVSGREDEKSMLAEERLYALTDHLDDDLAAVALSAIGGEKKMVDRLRELPGYYPSLPALLLKTGNVSEAEQTLIRIIPPDKGGVVQLLEFYGRNEIFTENTIVTLGHLTHSLMDNGCYRAAYSLFGLIYEKLLRYPKGNPPGEKEIPYRKELLVDMLLGEISCLFQMGAVRQGCHMLRALGS